MSTMQVRKPEIFPPVPLLYALLQLGRSSSRKEISTEIRLEDEEEGGGGPSFCNKIWTSIPFFVSCLSLLKRIGL